MKFSERYGYTPVKDVIQFESIDNDLMNGLWNLLIVFYFDVNAHSNSNIRMIFYKKIWIHYFKKPVDEIMHDIKFVNDYELLDDVRKYFFESSWFEIYDFIEFAANNHPAQNSKIKFIKQCNILFEKENSGYRFVDDKITPITDQQEIDEVQQALDIERPPIKEHLRRALELLSDKTTPDYRNSIKESISAVESLVKQVIGEKNGTLGQLLKKLKENYNLPPVLESAFSKLYGYTSDKEGIRHALIEESNINFHDAKFMLVICSAFINFVEGKIVNN